LAEGFKRQLRLGREAKGFLLSTGSPFPLDTNPRLIDTLIATAHAEVAARNAGMSESECRQTAEAIATAAVRYFLVKFTRTKIIAFDIDEADVIGRAASRPLRQLAADLVCVADDGDLDHSASFATQLAA
jgi:hypothetical protein